MEYEELIRENLKAIAEDFDELKPFMQKRLVEVETVIQNRREEQENAVEILKSTDYSLKSIANEIGASRTTLYNHEQLLKRYIEYSASIASSTNPLLKIDKIQAEKSLLQEEITKLMERDVDIELMRIQNKELSTSLEGKNTEIERLQKRISELSEENHKLKSEISTKTRKIFN